MIYSIKPILTVYGGVKFRSRLEARWAAFFDLVDIKWDYEPFDMHGWTPDFILKIPEGNILTEIKPIDFYQPLSAEAEAAFQKAAKHAFEHNVMLLGVAPHSNVSIGVSLVDCPLVPVLRCAASWRVAGNTVQWREPEVEEQDDYYSVMRRLFRRKAA